LPRPQQRLIRPCPACGKDMGFVTLRKWERPNYKKRLDYETGQKYTDFESPIMKKTLPYEKGPIPEEVKSAMYDAILSVNKEILFWTTFTHILKEKNFFETYPDIIGNAVYYGRGIQVATDLIRSLNLHDKRSKLHFVDLLNISLLIRNHSYHEVAKKFGVSIKFIKIKESLVLQQAEAICKYMPGYIEFRKRINQILETDRELREKFMKYAERSYGKSE
jgi:hypothetical protein